MLFRSLQPSRRQVAFVAGRTIGGHFNNVLSRLHTQGLVDYTGPGLVGLSIEGQKKARLLASPPTHEALLDMIRSTLGTDMKRQIFDVLVEAGKPITREELSTRIGRTIGGHFNNSVSRLSSLGIVHYPSRGLVGLSDLVNFA